MTYRKCISMLCAVTIGAVTAMPVAADMGRRYLAVDESLHGAGTTLNMVMGQATHEREIFRRAETFEMDYFPGGIGGVIEKPDGGYRIYYEMRSGSGNQTAILDSTDGLDWHRVQTDHLVAGSNFINIINVGAHRMRAAFYDDQTNQYIMLHREDGYSFAVSGDGVTFFPATTNAFSHKMDTMHTMFYDTMREQYTIYGRIRSSGTPETGGWPSGDTDRRGIPRHSSPQWDDQPWQTVGELAADPLDYWDYETHPNSIDNYPYGAGPDLYRPGIMEYHGQYVGFASVFHREADRVPHTRPERVTGEIYPMFMHSLDGLQWNIPDPENPDHPSHPIINLEHHQRVNQWEYATNKTDLEVGQMYAVPGLIERGNDMLVYYNYRDDTHYEAGTTDYPNPHFTSDDVHYHVARMRVDGFASLKTEPGQSGEWHTGNVEVPNAAKGLLVNAKVEEGGSLRVEVLDTEGQVIGNLSLANSIAFQGDETSAFMNWSAGQFQEAAGQEVQLRFVVEDGEIYSFSWSPIPEPASVALMGLGGLMLLRRRRIA